MFVLTPTGSRGDMWLFSVELRTMQAERWRGLSIRTAVTAKGSAVREGVVCSAITGVGDASLVAGQYPYHFGVLY